MARFLGPKTRPVQDRARHACGAAHVTGHHDVLQHAHLAKDLQVLEGTRDAAPRPSKRRLTVDALAVEPYLAGTGCGDAGDHVEQRALAGAVRPDHRLDLAGADAEAQIGDGRYAIEVTGQRVDLQQLRS